MDGEIRLLHVDDEPEFAELTATFLEREHDAFVVETATNVSEALDRLPNGIDGIISDYDMPQTDGLAFLERVRETHPDLPFILFTGQGSEEIASDAISAGVTDYLQKKSGTGQYAVLANRMQNAVEQYRSERALEASQKRLSLLIEQSPLGVLEYNDDLEIVRVNETGEEILGYTEAELRGHTWEKLVTEASYESVDEVTDKLAAGTGGYHSIDENVRGDGERIICEWHNRIVTDDDGDTVAVFSMFQDITGRREERQRLEALIDNLPGIIYRSRNESGWPIELVRGACEELTGYSTVELRDRIVEFEEIIHPADRSGVKNAVEAGLRDGNEFEIIYRIVRKDDDVRWIWERGQLIETPTTDGELFEGLLIDITDLKTDAIELERTNTVLSTLLENLPVGVLVENESRDILTVNSTLLDMFDADAPPEALVGRDCEQVADELKGAFAEPDAFVDSTDEKHGSTDPTRREELELADGRIIERDHIPYELSEQDADLWVYYDVTDERERQRLLAGLFEEALDGIGVKDVVTDADGEPIDYVYKRVNDRFEELTGIDADAAVGNRATEVIDGIEETPFVEIFGDVALGGEPRTFEQYSEPLGKHYEISAFSPHHGRCITVFSDITDRKERERTLRRQRDRFEAFADLVSHDLRNPLQVAQGRIELARDDRESEDLAAAADALDRSQSLIDDLLTMARQDEDVRDVEAIELDRLVDACWGHVETNESALALESPPTVRADRSRLGQLLENLIANAVEHGGGEVTITVGSIDGGFYLEDDGAGIPESERESVFESGYSTDVDGTGFGLSIAREIADAHGWTIAAVEGNDGGARFEIRGVDVVDDQ
jgi:PAS domain S-box-containing protein